MNDEVEEEDNVRWVEVQNARVQAELQAFNALEMRPLARDGSLDVRAARFRFPEFSQLLERVGALVGLV